jgi:hypothetical protein
MTSTDYSENALVEQPAITLFDGQFDIETRESLEEAET